LPQEKVIFSFTVDNEKYFFQSQLYTAKDENFWEINAEMDLYKLQRRDSYRIKIPPTIKTVVLVKTGGEENAFATGHLTDLSVGGCKVSLPGIFPIIAGQNVSLDITVPRRPTFSVIGEIRHIRKIAHPNPQQSLGIKFRDVTSTLESKLFSITLELHRDLNQKVSNS
jgi:c-di-GMP-binding flagellar brake protein YcgR